MRHFLELFPPLAILAGRAIAALATGSCAELAGDGGALRRPCRRRWPAPCCLPGLAVTRLAHPFEITYWNSLVGGFPGAREKNLPQASDYWGMSYRQGLEWLNRKRRKQRLPGGAGGRARGAPGGAAAPAAGPPAAAGHPADFSPKIAPERLAATRELARQGTVYVMFVERRDWANELMVDCLTYLQPEVVWTNEGQPVALDLPLPPAARPAAA